MVIDNPLTKNCTFVTASRAVAVAVTSMFVGPSTMWPFGGAVTFATGVPMASCTTTRISGEVVVPP